MNWVGGTDDPSTSPSRRGCSCAAPLDKSPCASALRLWFGLGSVLILFDIRSGEDDL
eukprot:m.186187 g.186187  ORF g.186187 m.186187 type:complete len:57 (-) comp32258_c2_seq1:381-551(-)